MKKLMFAALAVASCSAFAAAAPEPACKAYNLTVTRKQLRPEVKQMTQKNIPTNEVEKAWEEAEAAAPVWPIGDDDKFFVRDDDVTTNKNGTVTIKWTQYKPAKNGTNIVVSSKVVTTKDNYIAFLDEEGAAKLVYYFPSKGIDGFKYYGYFDEFLAFEGGVTLQDGKCFCILKDAFGEGILAGTGKAAKSNPADKNSPYDYMKSVAGNSANSNGSYGTWKWSYDKKLSQAFDAAAKEKELDIAIAEALKTKKIYLPEED